MYVQPAELARKLVKEMEDHKVSGPARVSVSNRYTIFLCPSDYERLRDRKEALVVKLERHLAKHVRAKKYEVPGDLGVEIVIDDDLKLGHFGILAESDARGYVEEALPPRVRAEAPERSTRRRKITLEDAHGDPPARVARPRPERTAKPARGAATGVARGSTAGTTAVIAPGDAERLDLARRTIVLRAGNRKREFTQGKVIVGRARDADFRVDDPNVSRQHAAIFWSNGDVMIEDLDSTNGTMVNGYPVSSTVIRPGDVVVVGDCRITVETR